MSAHTSGLTLVEVMVALVILAAISLVSSSMLINSIRSDSSSNMRGQAMEAATTWIDRYRAKQEPTFSNPDNTYGNGKNAMLCSTSSTTVNCDYGYNYTYPAADWSKHSADLASTMSKFRHVIQLNFVSGGTNFSVASIKVQTFWKQPGGEQSVTLESRINY